MPRNRQQKSIHPFFASAYLKIIKYPAFVKLKHDYKETAKLCNRKLRNAIAHHDFKINPDGSIEYYNYGKKLETNNFELRRRINDIYVMFAFLNERRAMALRVEKPE